ncbi:MAG: InlB B-repeat-containing protein, partial [Firmicutes bacterium]|nr:InlB B-repeat-containing protein [Bacillota bacterium]
GTWDDSHTKVVYDPNPAQGGIVGTAPLDGNEYSIWQSSVPVAAQGETKNSNPDMIFVGWQLDRDGVVYQPGNHVAVRWPRTMIFTAQWAKAEDVVYLRYDPNGGTPEDIYPNDSGFAYKRNATASVWDNMTTDEREWFSRTGYTFAGWNSEPDGSGTAYGPGANIVLTNTVTTLYAQWERQFHTLSLYKEDFESGVRLEGAEFGLYKKVNDMFLLVDSFTSGVDGHAIFTELETDYLYKLVEEKPPNGYAIITKDIYFKLKADGGKISLMFYDAEGKQIAAPKGVSGEYITGNHRMTITVSNLRGYELPSTGGMGNLIYLLCGLILVLAPLVYGLSLRRKHERRSQE